MKKWLTILLVIALLLGLTACGSTPEVPTSQADWAVYWYLCGSDLETNFAAATNDLAELLEVELPENVQVVIQTGGSSVWQNDLVSADTLGRYLYDQNGLQLVEELPSASMGDAQTLRDFLSFAKENYPAKHTAVVLWNHGGGSVAGVAFDQLYNMESLTLSDLYSAFYDVFGEDPQNQPVDIIGFDACLMATVDVAFTFSDIAKYLVASQELEPGNGWLYSGWVGAIAQNPGIQPLELATAICDSYYEGCELVGTQDHVTLSVTDLSKVSNLISAYDDFGKEALAAAVENPAFYTHFTKIANSVENFGGNTREQGYTNMADLGHLAAKSAEMLPQTSGAVTAALADCVVYKVNGKYRPDSAGLSCYFSYNGDVDDLNAYMSIGPAASFKYLYAYGLTGELSEDGLEYLAQMNYNSLPELPTLNSVNWQDIPLTVDADGNATLTLGSQAADILSSLTFELYYADPEEDILLCLGTDNDIVADWENGIFKDNFRGVWGSLDGALCYMEIAYEGDGFNQYTVPILLNGEEYNLLVTYDFGTEEFYIDGARKPLDESGAADKNLRYLVEGDEIQTIHYGTSISGKDDELIAVPVDTIIVTPETTFAEIELGDGMFIMMYYMTDSQGNTAFSSAATFEIKDGQITTSVTDEVPNATPAAPATTKPTATAPVTPTSGAPTNYAKFTDGNSYVAKDMRYIIKINSAFSDYEVLYEISPQEGYIVNQPQYLNNSLFFETFFWDTSTSNIIRLDLATGKMTNVIKNKSSSELATWCVLSNNKILYRSFIDSNTSNIWMCDLDGSNLKKTSASGSSIGDKILEYNGKIYMTDGGEGGWSFKANFYSMNMDGTGFQKLFSVTHNWCSAYYLDCIQDGYLYYLATTTKDKPDSQDGNYKIKLDGTGQTMLLRGPIYYMVSNGKAVYYTYDGKLYKLTASGQKSQFSILDGAILFELTPLYNGYILAETEKESYIVSDTGNKAYNLDDFSPEDPYAGYKYGFNLISAPTKTTYEVGEGFDPSGFEAGFYHSSRRIFDELSPDHKAISFYTSGTVQLTEGRPFTTAGKKVVEIRYEGKKVAEFTIQVNEASKASEPKEAPKSSNQYEAIASGEYDGAPYRDAPNGEILGVIPAGTVVELLEKSGDWGRVAYDGGEYYVWFARLKKVSR